MGIKRRAFLFGSLAVAGAGVFGLSWSGRSAGAEAIAATRREGEGSFAAWLKIARDGTVTLYSPTIDMGQGSHTAHAQMVADELGVPLERVVVEQAPPLPGFANTAILVGFAGLLGMGWMGRMPDSVIGLAARKVPVQATGGSSAMRFTGQGLLRPAAAGARQLLAEEAASRLGVPVAELTMADGAARHADSGRSLGYGELAEAAAGRTLARAPQLAPIRPGRAVGQKVPRRDIPAKVDGSAVYGIDVQAPGMRVATVIMAPVRGGQLDSVDEKPALAVPGVEKVIRLADAVVVVGTGYWAAWKGAQALSPKFSDGGHGAISSVGITAEQGQLIAAGKADKDMSVGDPDKALATPGAKLVEAEYRVPYLHHAMMETFAMTAHFKDGKLEAWAGLQDPLATRVLAAKAADLALEDVTFHPTLLGGGFGRKVPQQSEIIAQVVAVAKQCPWPVKLIWSREQEVQHGSYRPQGLARMKAAVKDGRIIAWQTDFAQRDDPGSEVDLVYDLPAVRRRHFSHKTNQVDGPFRSVNSSQFGFYTEGFIDELAAAAGEDPYRFRRKHLGHDPRAAKVLDEAARLSGWGTPLPAGTGRGIAIVKSFDSYVAEVIEASLREDGWPKIHKVTAVVDCGTTVNPLNAEAQVQGAIVQALSTAVGEAITLEKGAVVQSSFPDYPLLKLADAPAEVAVHFIESGAALGGIGEVGVPPATPALVNALAAATGKRVRSLPVQDQLKA